MMVHVVFPLAFCDCSYIFALIKIFMLSQIQDEIPFLVSVSNV